MCGLAIPRVMNKHPGPQPSPETSHYDCTGVNCTQKNLQLGAYWMGTSRAPICLVGVRQGVSQQRDLARNPNPDYQEQGGLGVSPLRKTIENI